ncbi:M14 family zinc carboxypeptidase [Mesonia maritima]|uniref:Peptidase M14 domain-containing protein n=1 Tax=Mesonia maritima TaxID=1793873 RepID=A0ABU1K964_9FLAO|nr:M14 family zinc carboxypeptidase [Mesonia maritima]MDR6302146.1 hypothetical protein [Mesonia maritima]
MKATEILQSYTDIKNSKFSNRYLSYPEIEDYCLSLQNDSIFKIQEIGKSVQGKNIYSITVGNGPTKILLWSQMHGNESTTTKSVLDLLQFISNKKTQSSLTDVLQDCTLTIIPVLNPDGLKNYTRVNANEVDLNRDALDLSQPESRILRKVFTEIEPDFCLNLHDQRTIFSAGNRQTPATVSFLAPAFNERRSINENRLNAMRLIAEMNTHLQEIIPQQVGRYDDAFNLNCVGDYFQYKNATTILFEAGHFKEDYQREETRKFIFTALYKALKSIVNKTYNNYSEKDYDQIPENEKLFFDIIIRNVEVNNIVTDLAIQYQERLVNNELKFIPQVKKIGELHNFFGHREFEGKGKIVRVNSSEEIQLGIDIQQISLNNEDFFMNLTIS